MPKHMSPSESDLKSMKREYEEEVRAVIEYGEDAPPPKKESKRKIMLIYISGGILVIVAVFLMIWMSRDTFSLTESLEWIKVQLVGAGEGDGFPVQIKGTNIAEKNFISVDGDVAALSDTALTVMNSTGKELYSVRHSFDNPFMHHSGNNFILYNSGGAGYIVQRGVDTAITGTEENDISAAAVAKSGEFALGVQGREVASELNVYMRDGTAKYNYQFFDTYITAISLNADGSMGAVCSMGTQNGELISKITILDFNNETPVAQYESRGNMLLDILWGESGRIYAVGDSALIIASDEGFDFQEFSYGGQYLTAYSLENNRAYVSISGHEYTGGCTVHMFSDNAAPVLMETDTRVESISPIGGAVGVLTGEQVIFFETEEGRELDRASAGTDVKSIALASENMAYALGISEIRAVSIRKSTGIQGGISELLESSQNKEASGKQSSSEVSD